MKRLALGILAHVDAGKTTLTEGLLYRGGALRRLGRVDHKDAFLDTDPQERARGITIFAKQARIDLPDSLLQLLDTPGHVDFSSEMERTLQVLDYAILVISATDGVQGHTLTLWRLLDKYRIPVFLFVNKMDLAGTDKTALLAQLRRELDPGCVDFGGPPEEIWEECALCDETLLSQFLEEGRVSRETIGDLIATRKVYPCWFGSALKLEGVDAFLTGLDQYTRQPDSPAAFGAKVYKIARDPKGTRLTHLKVTGGTLRVKDLLTGPSSDQENGQENWQEKADQIRLYDGEKFTAVEEAPAGTVCAVTGLSKTVPGQGLGIEATSPAPLLEPVVTYQVNLPPGSDPVLCLQKLRPLEEEDPQLRLTWNEKLRVLQMQLMGQVQGEVLQTLIQERFGLAVTFGQGRILYKETLAAPVEGVGHFEPLRHYAEVRLLLSPGERGSGIVLAADCPENLLDLGWQRLILSHLREKEHRGVLTGSPVTDLRLTLVGGRAHVKHTEGGDFRQATYRAVRQGLMEGESLLLEPWYDFQLEVPAANLGRALSDLTRLFAKVDPPGQEGETALVSGSAPVACLQDYGVQVAAYTKGRGQLRCTLRGYDLCHNPEEVIAARAYDPEGDLDNTPDSVFCTHGAGHTVKWDQVKSMAHTEPYETRQSPEPDPELVPPPPRRPASYAGTAAEDKELQAIFERTYGPIKSRQIQPTAPARPQAAELDRVAVQPKEAEYLLVDGYNIIFAWDELKAIARDNLDAARKRLMDILSNYQGWRRCQVILVFDAYKVKGGRGEVSRYHNITVVYTKEAETADAYIEKTTYEMARRYRVRVATSDSPEQLIILGHGALRLSARTFYQEVAQARGEMDALLAENNRKRGPRSLENALRQAKKPEE